jgi:murein DD-endopeptidase MepM/ murein hydrolase activator NlpD
VIAFASVVRFQGPGSHPAPPQVASRAEPPPTGQLMVPVQGVARADLRDSWSDPRDGGARTHHALDILAPAGTPVLAATGGRVEKLFESKLGGHTVYVRSPDGGTVYYYAHLDRYAPTLVEGQVIGTGQVLGSVGSTGDADAAAPHLHFEIHRMAPGEGWWQGEGVDPYPLLKGA